MDQFCVGSKIEEFEIIKVLSIGVYGQVYLAIDNLRLKRYVIKSLPHTNLNSKQLMFQHNEINLHSKLTGHPNVIKLERVIETTNWTHAILEYGSEGDLFGAITEKGLYYGHHGLIRHVFLQLINVVRYCHEQNIYHRDLKPENILVFDQGRKIKLADFGLATTDSISKDYGCGSTFYYSPECQGTFDHLKKGYSTAANDVWSLGIILINLAAGRNPWRTASLEDETFCGFLQDPNLLLKILPISTELNKILKMMFCLDPKKRIKLDELSIRIQRCTFFTRTPEVIRYESMMAAAAVIANTTTINTNTIHDSKSAIKKRQYTRKSIKSIQILDHLHLPSPPSTPQLKSKVEESDLTCSTSYSSIDSTLTDHSHTHYTATKKSFDYLHVVL